MYWFQNIKALKSKPLNPTLYMYIMLKLLTSLALTFFCKGNLTFLCSQYSILLFSGLPPTVLYVLIHDLCRRDNKKLNKSQMSVLFKYILQKTKTCFKLLCLAKDHLRGFSTRNAHMVHIVEFNLFLKRCIHLRRSLLLYIMKVLYSKTAWWNQMKLDNQILIHDCFFIVVDGTTPSTINYYLLFQSLHTLIHLRCLYRCWLLTEYLLDHFTESVIHNSTTDLRLLHVLKYVFSMSYTESCYFCVWNHANQNISTKGYLKFKVRTHD